MSGSEKKALTLVPEPTTDAELFAVFGCWHLIVAPCFLANLVCCWLRALLVQSSSHTKGTIRFGRLHNGLPSHAS